jgi:hypothetical protein
MVVSITVYGAKEAADYLSKVSNKIQNISNLEFAQYLKQKAEENLQESSKGWPNTNSTGIHFVARTQKLADGASILMYAVGIGSDGYNYAGVQEVGYPLPRFSRSVRALMKGRRMNLQPMRFRTPAGKWVSKYEVGPIPAKKYMEKTAEWAAEAYPRYIELKIEDAMRR